MKPMTAVEPDIRTNLLAEAAARNLPADLMVVRGENLQANLRARFLGSESERLLMEVPSHDGQPVVLQPGQFVEVYFKIGHERFGFDTRVIGYSRVGLNREQEVEAISLAPPPYLERRQRRKFYRVSVATLPALDARLWPAQADPSTEPAIPARLCNLSAGGVAILTRSKASHRFLIDDAYRLRFDLPGDADPTGFEFMAVVCHVRFVFQSRRQMVGLAFLPRPDPSEHREAMDRLARFVASQQREDLFRARSGP